MSAIARGVVSRLRESFDVDSAAVERLAARLTSGEQLALVVDYDRTISRGDAAECHTLLCESTALPSAFRRDVAALFLEARALRAGTTASSAPSSPHLFWERFNAIIVDHGVPARLIDRAVVAEHWRQGSILRPGWRELLAACTARDIPVVILSAGVAQLIKASHRVEGIDLPVESTLVIASELVFSDATPSTCIGVSPSDPPCSRVGKLEHLETNPRAVELLAQRRCVILVG